MKDSFYFKKNGRCFNMSTPECETICLWSNGKCGSFIDLYNDNTLRFIEYDYEPDAESEGNVVRKKYTTEEEISQCPIVAVGIIAFYFKCIANHIHDSEKIYEDYYKKCYDDYLRFEKMRLDYWERKNSIPLEFAQKHLKQELLRIVRSKLILEYLMEYDIKTVDNLTRNYIRYVKRKTKTSKSSIKVDEKNIFSSGLNPEKISSALKKTCRHGMGEKQFAVTTKEFFTSIYWVYGTTDVDYLKWLKQEKIVEVMDTRLQNVKPHKKKQLLLEELQSIFQRYNSHAQWEDKQEFYFPLCNKINRG